MQDAHLQVKQCLPLKQHAPAALEVQRLRFMSRDTTLLYSQKAPHGNAHYENTQTQTTNTAQKSEVLVI